ncbi:hypothetical protein SASPL_143863 [Salvia splendens]|uniref:Myb/SANT-like domain-containing protein n=1 Tax=Salvia splendens TaxID=180675 RepID=A0A8X8ZAQ3_SALSN|nr:hypothetical protein SASPL_143863 [Salvia splendens]
MADSLRVGPNTDFSQGTQGSSQYHRSSYQRNEIGHRSWTDREEAVLISALKELVALGWKSDNGFRGGYLTKIEELMQKEFPRTDIKGLSKAFETKAPIKSFECLSYY